MVNSVVFDSNKNTNIIKTQNKNIFDGNKKFYNEVSSNPNIYVLIMDGMTSLKYVKEVLGINIRPHKEYLNTKNFMIFPSKSNYNQTYLTMATMMHLDYVVTPNSDKYYDRSNFWPHILSKSENEPNLIKILLDNNYLFKWYGNMTASCKNYSYNKSLCPPVESSSAYYVFNSFFLHTPLIPILRKLFPGIILGYYGDGINTISNFLNL